MGYHGVRSSSHRDTHLERHDSKDLGNNSINESSPALESPSESPSHPSEQQEVDQDAFDQENDGTRPIHFAAYHGNQKLIDILMNSGADPTLSNNKNLNVLHFSAQGD